MADPKQFDVQGARDAGYSGAEIQLHLIQGLGYTPAEAQQAAPPPRDQQSAPQLPPSPDQRSKFPDVLSGVKDFITSLNPFPSADFPQGQYPSFMHPDYASFNERFTRTPGVIVPPGNIPRGVDAQYVRPSGYPGEGMGTIFVKPDFDSNMLSHEAAHSLYNQAALYRWGSKLEDNMNPQMYDTISNSRHYQRAIAQDPSALSDEGLGYAMNEPVPADEAYVNAVASRIEDPVIRQRLLNLFQHAKAMAPQEPGVFYKRKMKPAK
jgi:hypothetical protein